MGNEVMDVDGWPLSTVAAPPACSRPGCQDRSVRIQPAPLCALHWGAVREAMGDLRPPPGYHHIGEAATRIADRHGLVLFDRLVTAAADCRTAGWPPRPAPPEVMAQNVAAVLAALAAAADEALTSLAGSFNDAAARYAQAQPPTDPPPDTARTSARGRPICTPLPAVGAQATLDDLFLIREFLVRCGVKAAGDPDLELGSRYGDVTDAAAARAAAAAIRDRQRRALRKYAHRSLWSDLLKIPGVTGLRWRTLADQTRTIADLQAAS